MYPTRKVGAIPAFRSNNDNYIMKLSNQTKEILKNYSQINQNILIKQGNQLKTVSAMKNIVASATVPDEFSQEIPIYNLNEYLAAMSLFKEPVLSFSDKYMTIAEEDNSSSCKYHYSDPSVIVTVDKEIKMPSIDVEVDITEENCNKALKNCSTSIYNIDCNLDDYPNYPQKSFNIFNNIIVILIIIFIIISRIIKLI